MKRDFLRDDDFTPSEYQQVLEWALEFEKNHAFKQPFAKDLNDLTSVRDAVAVIFDKSSTRTRVSFETGVVELGGHPLIIDGASSQMGRGESIADTARVLDKMVKMVVWRTFGQERVEEMAKYAKIPVINSLTDEFHPCQIVTDLACAAWYITQRKGVHIKDAVRGLQGKTLVYFGDGANNMAHSYLLGSVNAGVNVRIACPEEYSPNIEIVSKAKEIGKKTGASVLVTRNPEEGMKDADIVTTDAWLSMGMDVSEKGVRQAAFLPYQVNAETMKLAKPDALFMHCLPAYRGQEVTEDVIDNFVEDGGNSCVFKEAEFRLHAQKAIMTFLAQNQ
ncbi:MAG: ornithine carbamoyltransferase [Candidatus Ancillula sp.]|jgi:ornithine carbamoyltransferase|nr:ornithine carbamoyltransferase [Candidatus Ancillula sp.]